jgi:uncharacterized protein (DUF2236 family)
MYRPTDAPWVVHRDFGTLVGGIRALLMQALHPGSLAGVRQHSRYEADPLGRLAGTIRWLTVTTFGSSSAVASEAGRVNRLHDRVAGTYQSPEGETLPYRAVDPELLLWVHVAFMESFLVSHETYTATPIPQGDAASPADNYIAQWGAAVAPLRLETVPTSRTAVDAMIDDLAARGVLSVSEETRTVVAFIRNPPLSRFVSPVYRLLFQAAAVTIEPRFRSMLGLSTAPKWIIVPTTRLLLNVMRWAVGPESPIEDAALQRLRRLGIID